MAVWSRFQSSDLCPSKQAPFPPWRAVPAAHERFYARRTDGENTCPSTRWLQQPIPPPAIGRCPPNPVRRWCGVERRPRPTHTCPAGAVIRLPDSAAAQDQGNGFITRSMTRVWLTHRPVAELGARGPLAPASKIAGIRSPQCEHVPGRHATSPSRMAMRRQCEACCHHETLSVYWHVCSTGLATVHYLGGPAPYLPALTIRTRNKLLAFSQCVPLFHPRKSFSFCGKQ